jgi:hypothetical protein
MAFAEASRHCPRDRSRKKLMLPVERDTLTKRSGSIDKVADQWPYPSAIGSSPKAWGQSLEQGVHMGFVLQRCSISF